MIYAGVFWRKRPTTTTSYDTWGWCEVWLDAQGLPVLRVWL
jgi:hypothetical protein